MALDLTGLAVDNLLLSQATAEIGAVRETRKDPTAFSNENLGQWMLMNGQSCVGTQYETDFGETTVPDAYTNGAFLRQAKAGRNPGTFENDAMQGHHHQYRGNYWGTTGAAGSQIARHDQNNTTNRNSGMIANPTSDGTNGTPRTANETRPKNIAVNFMIKVGH